jgi:predicted RNase H-related nuclease YkuK (DUF458 family)
MKNWKTFYGKDISIEEFIEAHKNEDRSIIIGTDSQTTSCTRYTTAIVYYKEGKGAVCLHKTLRERKAYNLHEQLFKETWLSIGAALEIIEISPDVMPEVVNIHLDVNTDPKHASARYKNELVGMVAAQGFSCEVKPDSWVSTHIADHIVRNSIASRK